MPCKRPYFLTAWREGSSFTWKITQKPSGSQSHVPILRDVDFLQYVYDGFTISLVMWKLNSTICASVYLKNSSSEVQSDMNLSERRIRPYGGGKKKKWPQICCGCMCLFKVLTKLNLFIILNMCIALKFEHFHLVMGHCSAWYCTKHRRSQFLLW